MHIYIERDTILYTQIRLYIYIYITYIYICIYISYIQGRKAPARHRALRYPVPVMESTSEDMA